MVLWMLPLKDVMMESTHQAMVVLHHAWYMIKYFMLCYINTVFMLCYINTDFLAFLHIHLFCSCSYVINKFEFRLRWDGLVLEEYWQLLNALLFVEMVCYLEMSPVMTRIMYLEMAALGTVLLKQDGYAASMEFHQHVLQTVAILNVVVMDYVEGHQALGRLHW